MTCLEVSGVNSVAAISNTIEITGGPLLQMNKPQVGPPGVPKPRHSVLTRHSVIHTMF